MLDTCHRCCSAAGVGPAAHLHRHCAAGHWLMLRLCCLKMCLCEYSAILHHAAHLTTLPANAYLATLLQLLLVLLP